MVYSPTHSRPGVIVDNFCSKSVPMSRIVRAVGSDTGSPASTVCVLKLHAMDRTRMARVIRCLGRSTKAEPCRTQADQSRLRVHSKAAVDPSRRTHILIKAKCAASRAGCTGTVSSSQLGAERGVCCQRIFTTDRSSLHSAHRQL